MTDEQTEQTMREIVARLDEDHRKCQERYAQKYERYKAMDALDSESFREIGRDFDAERAYIRRMREGLLAPFIRRRALMLDPIFIQLPLNPDSTPKP